MADGEAFSKEVLHSGNRVSTPASEREPSQPPGAVSVMLEVGRPLERLNLRRVSWEVDCFSFRIAIVLLAVVRRRVLRRSWDLASREGRRVVIRVPTHGAERRGQEGLKMRSGLLQVGVKPRP